MKRRDFLKTGGIAGTAGLILDGCGKPQQLIPLLISDDRFVPGEKAGCGRLSAVLAGAALPPA